MQYTYKQFLKKFLEMHENFAYYYDSEILSKNILALINKTKFGDEEFWSVFLQDLIMSDFDFESLSQKIPTQVAADFIGIVLLPAIEFLPQKKIKEYFSSIGGDNKKYIPHKNSLLDELGKNTTNALEEYIDYVQENTNKKEEREVALTLFKNWLADILKAGTKENITSLNGGLIFLLNNVKNFKEDAVKALLENNQKIAKEGKTLSEWLKEFIRQNSSDSFDNLVLAKFMTSSRNSQSLKNEEISLVSKLLETYRNIKFWPQSMEDKNPEDWQIIPLPKSIEEFNQEDIILAKLAPTESPQRLIQPKEKKEEEKLSPQEEKLKKLKEEAQKYPVSSIERQAIEWEIAKLKKNM